MYKKKKKQKEKQKKRGEKEAKEKVVRMNVIKETQRWQERKKMERGSKKGKSRIGQQEKMPIGDLSSRAIRAHDWLGSFCLVQRQRAGGLVTLLEMSLFAQSLLAWK